MSPNRGAFAPSAIGFNAAGANKRTGVMGLVEENDGILISSQKTKRKKCKRRVRMRNSICFELESEGETESDVSQWVNSARASVSPLIKLRQVLSQSCRAINAFGRNGPL
jgi:hypothetical protein